MKERIRSIDYLKSLAILAVVFYHIGIMKNGYLGVEIFFVVGGYLFFKTNKDKLENGEFKPFHFVLKKVMMFWPLIVIGGLICLGIGAFYMLPDDYENLAQSVFASNVFANNVLQAITTKDYWNVSNIYKPLMHTWYISVLLQNYIFLSFTLWGIKKVCKKVSVKHSLIVFFLISFGLYLLPCFSQGDKFYYPWFRLFEIVIGCLIVYLPTINVNEFIKKTVIALCTLGIISILFFINVSNMLAVLIAVVLTFILLWTSESLNEIGKYNEKVHLYFTIPGRYSYDVYIWHQMVVAFCYYFLFQEMNIYMVLQVIIVTGVASVISVTIRKLIIKKMDKKSKFALTILVVVISSVCALFIYFKAGVLRDIPELGIKKDSAYRNMHAQYVDIPYSWDNDFKDESKVHVLIMGNSFGRDFANILNESSISEQIEISYLFGDDASAEIDRIEQADFVFYAKNNWKVSDWALENIDVNKLYIVGNKSFGNSNGIIYANKDDSDYFMQRVKLPKEFLAQNIEFKKLYGDNYIDMITPLLDGDQIRVFTDDFYFISQDGKHLTEYGACYYARILDLSFIIDSK